MIVVVGVPGWRPAEPPGPAGRACEVALAAAAAGARAELVGRVGDDRPGDALVMALARAGVGHAAALRDPARPTPLWAAPPGDEAEESVAEPTPGEPATPASRDAAGAETGPRLEAADVSLALSYLTAFSVLVVTDDAPRDVLRACVDGAAFAGAWLVVLLPAGAPAPSGLPEDATVLAAPGNDVTAFARLVGAYAAALDGGQEPAAAFSQALAGSWERPASEGAGSPQGAGGRLLG